MHRDVVGLDGDQCVCELTIEADGDEGRAAGFVGEEAVVEAAAATEAVAGVVEYETWDEDEIELGGVEGVGGGGGFADATGAGDEVGGPVEDAGGDEATGVPIDAGDVEVGNAVEGGEGGEGREIDLGDSGACDGGEEEDGAGGVEGLPLHQAVSERGGAALTFA